MGVNSIPTNEPEFSKHYDETIGWSHEHCQLTSLEMIYNAKPISYKK